jgi:hypothetical protein
VLPISPVYTVGETHLKGGAHGRLLLTSLKVFLQWYQGNPPKRWATPRGYMSEKIHKSAGRPALYHSEDSLGGLLHQPQILSSMANHLDSLEKYSIWSIVTSVVLLWSSREGTPELLGISPGRYNPITLLVAVCLFYSIVFMLFTDRFLRLGSLLQLLDTANFKEGISVICLHRWYGNPFSTFGSSKLSRMFGSLGATITFLIWCFHFWALLSVADFLSQLFAAKGFWLRAMFPASVSLTFLTWLISLVKSVHRVFHVAMARQGEFPEVKDILGSYVRDRVKALGFGLALSLILAYVIFA